MASESECLKWLSDFSGKSKTEWKVRNATDVKGSNWAATYQCKKEAAGCAAKIVFRLDKEANSIRERENPCKIHISFYHSHHNHSTAASNVTSSTVTSSSHNGGGHSASASSSSSSSSTFNKHDIPAHLKEPFEGYFQPKTASAAMQPVALSEVQPQSSPSGGRAVILTEQEKVQNRAFQQQQKFEAVVNILRNMLKRGDSGSASVIRFVDTAKKLASFTSSSTSLLEAALNDFGSGLEDKIRQHQQRQWQQQFQQERERQRRQQEEDLMRKRKSGIKSQVLPGEIDPLTGKRRKRSRCGTCEGCINRDKTQDCRQCRNCLDQKRYGGPGRLKKACVRRSCAVMADQECSSSNNNNNSSHSSSTSPNSNSNGGSSSVALPLHPVPVSMTTAFSVWPTAAQHAAAALQVLTMTLFN